MVKKSNKKKNLSLSLFLRGALHLAVCRNLNLISLLIRNEVNNARAYSILQLVEHFYCICRHCSSNCVLHAV